MAAFAQHPADFGIAPDLIGKEHHAELAGDKVEAGFFERQIECVGLAK